MHFSDCKELIGKKAVSFIKDGMTVGLGTGTTAAIFIHCLAARLQIEPLNIICTSTSLASENLARSLNIPTVSIDQISKIDIAFDGADQIDSQKRMIKGAGGALLREKIVARASDELVVLAEGKKCRKLLGKTKLPVEVTPFGHIFTQAHLANLGYTSELRMNSDHTPYITDNHNFIYDIHLTDELFNPETDEQKIRAIPGVVETGFFFHLAGRVVVCSDDGCVKVIS